AVLLDEFVVAWAHATGRYFPQGQRPATEVPADIARRRSVRPAARAPRSHQARARDRSGARSGSVSPAAVGLPRRTGGSSADGAWGSAGAGAWPIVNGESGRPRAPGS